MLIIALFACQFTKAQMWLGVYGYRLNSTEIAHPEVGGGFGMNFMSKELNPGGGTGTSFLKVQYGFNFNFTFLGQRTFQNVPLVAPQMGLAKVTLSNSLMSTNIQARVTAPNKSIFIPYGEVNLGYRGTFTSMDIYPYQHVGNYSNQTSVTLAAVSGLNYGIGGGVMTNLGKNKKVRLDLGVMYMEQAGSGHYGDLANTQTDASGVNLSMKQVPNGVLMMNVGLLFYLEPGKDDDCDCKCKHHTSGGRFGFGGGRWWNMGMPSSVNVHTGGGFGGVRVK